MNTTLPDLPSSTAPAEFPVELLGRRRPVIETMLNPRTVALIGATEALGSVGRTLLENLTAGEYAREVFPVNPKRAIVLGTPAFDSIADVPGPVDLAIICTPAATVPGLVGECAKAGAKGAIIISAGFKEIGPKGVDLERQVLANARHGRMRIIGPNCLGAMIPGAGLNATFAQPMARSGSVGFISQSGALAAAVLDWSRTQGLGFSALISVGSMLDVGWGDLIYHLGDDPQTQSIVIYMETIGDARAFLSAAREVSQSKPIIVLKVGRTEAAALAAASHTGSLTGSDEVLDAAFRRSGVLRVDTISELFDMAMVLGKQPRPLGPRLAMVTNAGGPAALATDALMVAGGRSAALSTDTQENLSNFLPPFWSHNNPVDILGDADAKRYAKAVEIVARDPKNDGVLVILTPQAMTQSVETAEALLKLPVMKDKPLLASWIGGETITSATALLNCNNIPTFAYPDEAARAFAAMWRHSENLRALYETPLQTLDAKGHDANRKFVTDLLEEIRAKGRTILTEVESKEILEAYGIPVVMTQAARTEDEAARLAECMEGPYVVKLLSETITHKTDVGGVKLNLQSAGEVRAAYREIERAVVEQHGRGAFLGVSVQRMMARHGYEIILGCSPDPQFGPVILFGSGGELVEIYQDRALGLPPLNVTLARRMMEQTKIFKALKGVRGRRAVDLQALEDLVVRFSYLVTEQPWIKEIDINPLLVSDEGMRALDARVVLYEPDAKLYELPRPAIRPYPGQYVTPWALPDGTRVTIRPIRPEDEPLMVEFHDTLSDETVHQRYPTPLRLEERIAHERLGRICFTDYSCEIPLVVDHKRDDGSHEIVGVGRLNKVHGLNEATFALVISDAWQGKGLGRQLLRLLLEIGARENLDRVRGGMQSNNERMRRICSDAGFAVTFDELRNEWRAEITLTKRD